MEHHKYHKCLYKKLIHRIWYSKHFVSHCMGRLTTEIQSSLVDRYGIYSLGMVCLLSGACSLHCVGQKKKLSLFDGNYDTLKVVRARIARVNSPSLCNFTQYPSFGFFGYFPGTRQWPFNDLKLTSAS